MYKEERSFKTNNLLSHLCNAQHQQIYRIMCGIKFLEIIIGIDNVNKKILTLGARFENVLLLVVLSWNSWNRW